jgi:peptide/nickel transport system substrate-binding protein
MDIKTMQALVAKGLMSRRDFIQLSIAAGATVAAAEKMFVSAARAEPKKGGTFKVAVGSGATTDGLDPALFPDTFNGLFGWGTLRSSLTEVDASGKVVGDVAESFEASPDAKTWVFKLRKGVEFHNGKSLDANDVVASYNHHRGKDSKSAAKSLLEPVVDIKADGKDTVVFTLSAGNADFPYIASDFHLPVMPAVDGKADFASGIGTGPYAMTSFQPGVKGTGKRFANYHGTTWFDEVEILSIVDVTARLNALMSGEVHYIDRADPKTLENLKSVPDLEVAEVAGFAHYVAPMNTTIAPFDNKDVRLALKHAFNRQEIVEKVLLGHGSPGNDNPIAAGVPFSHDPAAKHVFDADKVKFHLKKGGMNTLKVDFSTSDAAFAGAVDAALLMKETAAKVGIDINVIKEPNDSYWDNVWMKKPWSMSYWSGRPTPDLMFTTAYAADAAWNETFWKNAKFNELLVAARSELDQAKRAAMYAEMQDLVADDGGVIVLMFYNYLGANSKAVAHGTIAPNWDVDGMKIVKRWWFA